MFFSQLIYLKKENYYHEKIVLISFLLILMASVGTVCADDLDEAVIDDNSLEETA